MRFISSFAGLSLSAKLVSGIIVVALASLAAMVGIGLYALRDLRQVNDELQEISRSLEAVQGLETAVARTASPLSAYLVDGAAGQQRLFEEAVREVEARLRGCGGAACHATSRQSRVMAESLSPFIESIRERGRIIFAPGDAAVGQARVRLLHEINEQGNEAYRRLERMSATLLRRVTALQEQSQQVSRGAATLILGTAALVLVLAAMSAWLLSRRLLKHVGELLTGTRHIMQGDLGYRVAVAERDEIGQLAQSFNAMAGELQGHRERLTQTVEATTAELRQAQDSLVQSEKLASIGLLAAGVAHELNNPLTSILMNVNLLMEDAGDQPALRAELQRISDDTMRCKRIIDDLRDFSRRHELDISPADLNALVQDALAALARGRELRGIAVSCELSRGIPSVPCDRARMEQVLGNVLVNAVQAMPSGGSLTVRTALRPGYAEIAVEDTGEGIGKEIRGRIFDPFFTTKPQGTGLGLSIVHALMAAHGGKAEVESATREDLQASGFRRPGTRMLLLLPVRAAPADNGVAPGRRA